MESNTQPVQPVQRLSTEDDRLEGSCNCDAVKVSVAKDSMVHVCHCTLCRKYSGSTSWTVLEVPTDKFELVQGRDRLKSWSKPGGDEWGATRWWCDGCGSAVYITVGEMPITFTASGLFPPGSIPKPFMHMFAKHIEPWERTVDGADVKQEMEGLA